MSKKVPPSQQLLKAFEEKLAFGELTLSDVTPSVPTWVRQSASASLL
jgi:hypothetical protein